jgi:hypothetical protein
MIAVICRASSANVEKSPILAQTKCHTLLSTFGPISLKTLGGAPRKVTHDSQPVEPPKSGLR